MRKTLLLITVIYSDFCQDQEEGRGDETIRHSMYVTIICEKEHVRRMEHSTSDVALSSVSSRAK